MSQKHSQPVRNMLRLAALVALALLAVALLYLFFAGALASCPAEMSTAECIALVWGG